MSMTPSVATDQAAVLAAVKARLQAQITQFASDNACFVVADPNSFAMPQRQTEAITIAPNSSEFDQDVFEGAGDDGIIEKSGFTVTIWSRVNLDRPDEATKSLTDSTRGLFYLKKLVLKALAGWMPQDNSGNSLLTEYIAPLGASFPEPREKSIGTASLSFSASWLWDLS